MSPKILTMWSILLFFTTFCLLPAFGIEYGNSCMPNDPVRTCDVDDFLECIDYSCQCNSSMLWDYTFQRTCSLKLGQSCVPQRTPGCYGTAACQPDNANNHVCTCRAPDYPSQNGDYCIHVALTTDEYCRNLGVTCDAERRLECDGAKCQCMDGWHNDTRTICYPNINTTCVPGSELPHESCLTSQGLQCHGETNRCECERPNEQNWGEIGYTKRFRCQDKVGARCNSSVPNSCVNMAYCNRTDQVCTCLPEGWIASPDRLTCVPPVVREYGDKCTITNDYLYNDCNSDKKLDCRCGPNFINCTCGCGYGTISNTAGVCNAGFNSSCQIGEENPAHLTCSEEAFLKCDVLEGKCGCQSASTQYWDGEKCSSKIGGECDPSGGDDPSVIQCHSSSTCMRVDDRDLCWCRQGYVVTTRVEYRTLPLCRGEC